MEQWTKYSKWKEKIVGLDLRKIAIPNCTLFTINALLIKRDTQVENFLMEKDIVTRGIIRKLELIS